MRRACSRWRRCDATDECCAPRRDRFIRPTIADILGGSFGGLIAQAFLQRFPQHTRRVVLSATGSAKPDRAASNEKFARVLPVGVARVLLRAIVRASLRAVTDDRAFWRDFYFRASPGFARDASVPTSIATARPHQPDATTGGERC